MKPITKALSCLALSLALALPVLAAEIPSEVTLFKNVNIFDGENEKLLEGYDVLVVRNLIKQVAKDIPTEGTYELDVKTGGLKKKTVQAGCTHIYTVMEYTGEEKVIKKQVKVNVIDGGGRTLTPGFIDAHTHIVVNHTFEELIYDMTQVEVGALATVNAKAMLERGFTTIRDVGGPSQGLKNIIDQGLITGPRILPSGSFISQSSGHGDFDPRMTYFSPHFTGQINKADIFGWVKIADGVPEVMKAVRENFRAGATQIKIMGSGSISGAHDPLDVTEYTFEELQAIVKEAEHWGTYATIHAYTDEGVQNAVKAGVRSVEHALFASDETMKLMKKKDVYFSTQFFAFSVTPEVGGFSGEAADKYNEAKAGAEAGFKRAKKYGLKMAWGTDTFGSLGIQDFQKNEWVARAKYYSPYEILVQATSSNAELLARAGKRHPYQEGPLGVIKPGAYADIIIVDGNPLKDIALLGDPEKNLKLIMKDGRIYKNAL